MIHRQNWLDVKEYLHHLQARLGRDPETIRKYNGQLRHLLEWADDTPFPLVHRIEPVFPAYLKTARNDGKEARLTHTTIYKTLVTTRAFFQFSRDAWRRYRTLPLAWIQTLHPHSKPETSLAEHAYYSVDEIKQIAAVATETIHQERAKAGACLMFLSGMRPDSMVSMPLHCIDLANLRLLQDPRLGIRTKNDKAGITYLLNTDEMQPALEVVKKWDQRVRSSFGRPEALWYAPLLRDGIRLKETDRAIVGRASMFGDDLRMICQLAGVEYKSPHKLRHGHIVYARSLARDMDDVKAISQNVMHSSIVITDQVYGNLKTSQVQGGILNLGTSSDLDKAELLRLIKILEAKLS